jgi:hypothetical protein
VTVAGMALTKRWRLLKRTATNYSSRASFGHMLRVFLVDICVGPAVTTIHMRPLYLACGSSQIIFLVCITPPATVLTAVFLNFIDAFFHFRAWPPCVPASVSGFRMDMAIHQIVQRYQEETLTLDLFLIISFSPGFRTHNY